MTAPDHLNLALLGTGFMGRAHSHAWATAGRFFDLPVEPTRAVVVGRDRERTLAFSTRWGWSRAATRWRAVLDDPEIDLVDIATPNSLHAEQALAALVGGKHVACEEARAGAMPRRSMRGCMPVGRRGAPSSGTATASRPWPSPRSWCEKDGSAPCATCGPPTCRAGAAPTPPCPAAVPTGDAGSGALGTLMAYTIDMSRFITGEEIVEVSGAVVDTFVKRRPLPEDPTRSARSTVDDAVLFLGRLSGGAVASFESTRLATGVKNSNRIEIHGDRGAIRFDFERMNELGYFSADDPPRLSGWRTISVTHEDHPWTSSWWPTGTALGYDHTFVNQAADIVGALAGLDPVVPLPDFADAYETQRVLEAALVSARERSAVRLSEIR